MKRWKEKNQNNLRWFSLRIILSIYLLFIDVIWFNVPSFLGLLTGTMCVSHRRACGFCCWSWTQRRFMCGRGSDSVNHLETCWKPQQEFPEQHSVPHTAPSFCLSWATRLDYRSTITFHLQTSSYLNMVSLCTMTSPYTGMHTIFAWGTAAISKVFQKDSISRVSWVFTLLLQILVISLTPAFRKTFSSLLQLWSFFFFRFNPQSYNIIK